MLETLREYALEQLEASGEAGEVRRRHAAIFLTLAERGWTELRGPRQAEWAVRLDHDHDNVRAALGWALAAGSGQAAFALRLAAAHAVYWALRGHLAEGRRWLAAALEADAGVGAPPALRARVTFWAGWLAWLQGDLGAGRALLAAGEAALRESGCAEATLWTEERNERPRRFYEAAGWTLDGAVKEDEFLETSVREVRYRVSLR
jgi:hypothetical protein